MNKLKLVVKIMMDAAFAHLQILYHLNMKHNSNSLSQLKFEMSWQKKHRCK